jgi:hypothetical protein
MEFDGRSVIAGVHSGDINGFLTVEQLAEREKQMSRT